MPRPPTPTALRLVQQGGKLRARHANRAATEPHPELGLREPPEHLNPEQVGIWRRLVADSPVGLLTKVDGDLFEGYCVLLAARNSVLRKFNEGGAHPLTGKALRVNPCLRQYTELTDSLRHLQGLLGYSPAARTRVSITPQAPADPLDRFLRPPKH